MMRFTSLFYQQLARESIILFRQKQLLFNACVFFFMIMAFFPLTMPADVRILQHMLPGLVWIALLLSFFLSTERMFLQDYDEGVIEQWKISGYSMQLFVSSKLFIHWLFNLSPLLILSPIILFLFDLPFFHLPVLCISLLCGSPALFSLCALVSVISLSLQQRGLYMALISFPLALPIMIFGSGTLSAALQGLPVPGYYAILLAISLLASSTLPFALGAVLRWAE